MRDDRWLHGMNGWRVSIVYDRGGASTLGEVTGYDPDHHALVVVCDGEEDPIIVSWPNVRPA